jgi:cell division protein FtsW
MALMRGYHRQDFLLAITTFLLVVFGLIMVSSASVVQSLQNTGGNYYYLMRQGGYALVGLVLWWFFSRLDYRFLKRFASIFFAIAVALLILVLVPGLSLEAGGAKRWIHLGVITFQVSEFVKLAVVIYLAWWFEKKGSLVKDFYKTFLPFVGVFATVFLLIMQQPDLGTATVVAAIAGSMYFVAGATWTQLWLILGTGIAGVVGLIYAAPYRLRRLITFLNPGADPLGAGYHINQALLALGSGGLFGLGYGHSRQKFNFLPEAASDSIFAIIGEELGLIGAFFLVMVPLAIIVWRGLIIAKNAPDTFGRLLALGITAWIGFQGALNMGAIVGVVPLTGVPLPFVSLGGTSLVFMLVGCGILLNISKQTLITAKDENPLNGWWEWGAYLANPRGRRSVKR